MIRIKADSAQVLAAQIVVERAQMGLQEATDDIRAYAAAKRIPGTDLYEVLLEDEPA